MPRSVLLLPLLQCHYLLDDIGCWQCLQFTHLSHFSCSHSRLSDWSAVFVFNASLSALAPSSPIMFPACWCRLLAMPAISSILLTFFLLTSQIKRCQCCADLQNFAQCFCSFCSNFVGCLLVLVVGNACNSSILLTFFLLTRQIQ